MTATAHIIDVQLAVLDQQVDPDRWKDQHEVGSLSVDIDDLVALALETLSRIRKLPAKHVPPDNVFDYFARWHDIALRALPCVEWIEKQGYAVEEADALRFAINEASIAAQQNRISAAQHRLDAGEGRFLDEIIDASKAG